VNWDEVSRNQKLSESFIREFQNRVNREIQKKNFKRKTLIQKEKEIKAYAKTYKLRFRSSFLYTYRNHDLWGHGLYNKTVSYEKGKYYRDWRCDMNPENENSFGLGIFPKGNTQVKVSVRDWGCAVNREDGKARVSGFTVL